MCFLSLTAKNDWDVLANTYEILVPVWDGLVGNACSDIKHDDGGLTADVVTITETTELLLQKAKHIKKQKTIINE